MLRRLVTSKKLLVIVPVVLALVLAGLFLPVEVSIEPYGVLSLESKITITIGYEAAYASPAEYLLNPAFTGGTTDWTLSTTTYDAGVFQDTAGSIKTITNVGKAQTATGTCSQTIGIPIDSSDSVKLSLYWQKGHAGGTPARQDLKAQIALPSDPATFIDIWSETTTGNIAWTEVPAFDVSAYFTETGTYQFRYYMDLESGNPPASQAWAWIDNTHLDVSLVPDISNLPTSKDFGTVSTSTDYWSNGGTPAFPLDDGGCYFTVTNNSSSAVNITIRATDFSGGTPGWTLGATPDADTVVLKVGKSGDAEGDMVTLTTSDQPFIASLDALSPKMWELKMETPTSFSNGDPKTSTVTLTAMFP